MFMLGVRNVSGYTRAVPVDPKTLPQDAESLRQIVVDLTVQLDRTERLLRQLLQAKTGRKSEQLSQEQLALFAAEAGIVFSEIETAEQEGDDDDPPPAATGENKLRGRKPLPRHLKRERIEHDLVESQKHCPQCGQDLRRIGEQVSERYEYIPAQMKVIEDACLTYACACTVKTATKPSQPIEKSTAGASLLAQVIVAKYADHLPLHRQVKMFARHGVDLSDETLCGWTAQCAQLLEPLYRQLKRFVLASKVVGTDDTPVKVLDRKLSHARKGRIWPYVGDREHVGVVYDYTPTRERAGPEQFLKNYRGHLQADAYVAYDAFFTKPERGMEEVGCWAHTRRHFHQALDSDASRMRTVLLLIAQLYRVERTARERGLGGEPLRLLRHHGAWPVLERLHAYLLEIQAQVLPRSEAGQAVAYALKNWIALTRYCDNPDLSIDNNATERALRCFAVGRANWTFFGSDRGGKTAAVLRSFVTSCELVRIDPFAWFRDVLTRIAELPLSKLDELLPHNWAAAAMSASGGSTRAKI
jgi:transposase